MSPFSTYFHDLRRRHRVSQKEIAHLMGYEQGYISGLEIGRKGPPNEEFIRKLVDALNLNPEEQVLLGQSVQESQRKYLLPSDASAEIFRLVHELWHEMNNLHPIQIRMIRDVLHLRDQISMPSLPDVSRRLCGVQKQEVQM